jgi:hypothetical protein
MAHDNEDKTRMWQLAKIDAEDWAAPIIQNPPAQRLRIFQFVEADCFDFFRGHLTGRKERLWDQFYHLAVMRSARRVLRRAKVPTISIRPKLSDYIAFLAQRAAVDSPELRDEFLATTTTRPNDEEHGEQEPNERSI